MGSTPGRPASARASGVRPALDIGPGSRLGKYEILKRLATGGMAEIFLARVSGLPGFQKMVVIKRILPQLATKSDFIEMFLDEARIAATLQHPNVVQMYDVGVVDGNYFIAMEYLHGEDVRSVMKTLMKREQKLPLEHALNIIIGVCSGLHYAHEKVGFDGKPLNIVHRDVTPQNIIVTYEGGVKLLDFGIAKASNRFGETRFGTLKGKVPYMSPEQCRGEPLDRRSDVFSLGIMLYELTLGTRLYKGASDFEILKQIVEGEVRKPSEIDPAYNKQLEAIVLRALEKDRDKRFQSAREMQAEIEALVREARMYVSPIALQQFMEQVFGQKIEAWREARAQGKTLGDHLQEVAVEATPLDDEDVQEASPEDIEAAERAAAERAALLAQIEAKAEQTDDEPGSYGTLPSVPGLDGGSGLSALRARRPGRWPLALVGAGVLALAAVAAIKLSRPGATPQPAAPVEAAATRPPPEQVGIVRIVTTPPGATLFLDGRRLELQSPATLDAIPAGEHTLLAQLDGHSDAVERFTLRGSDVQRVQLTLEKPAPPPQQQPTTTKKAPPARPAPKPAPKAIVRPVAAPPKPAAPKAEPPPPPAKLEGEGTLVLASSPWCNVTIDGVDKGPTPISVKLPAGKHTVVLSNPEFNIRRSLPVMVMPNETVRKKLDFTQ